MRRTTLCFLSLGIFVGAVNAADPPNFGQVMLYDYSTDVYSYGWNSEEKYPYFFQYSPDLLQWDFLNVIEPGDGLYKEWNFQIDENGAVPTERFFLRLAFPEQPMEGDDLINGDADGDKVGNQDELDQGTSPLEYAMNDADSVPDDWEIFHGLDVTPGIDSSTDDEEPDGLDNATEFALGTSPTDIDTDNDGQEDGDEVTQGSDPLWMDNPSLRLVIHP